MRRSTPNRYAERPPFTTSTSVSTNRATTPVAAPRRGVSPVVARSRAEFGRAVVQPQAMPQPQLRHASPSASFHNSHGAQRPRASTPVDETIGMMLNDLVTLSHNIERYIAENPVAGTSSSSPQQRVLKAEEIERVVRRVEVHFKGRVDELDHIVQEQKDVILQLSRERDAWKRRAEAAESSRKATDDAASDAATPRDVASSVQNLRQTLAEEKRQRLLVEEQTQHLTEQHTKVVNTLEQRIRKQEKQLQSMAEVFEQHGSSSSGAGGGPAGNGNGSGTPRSLKFRQRQLKFDEHPPTPDRTPGHSSSTLDAPPNAAPYSSSHRSSMQLNAAVDDVVDVINVSSTNSPRYDTQPPPSTVVPLEVDAEMDDVAAFLANISKELESISSVESQRQSKIAALSY